MIVKRTNPYNPKLVLLELKEKLKSGEINQISDLYIGWEDLLDLFDVWEDPCTQDFCRIVDGNVTRIKRIERDNPRIDKNKSIRQFLNSLSVDEKKIAQTIISAKQKMLERDIIERDKEVNKYRVIN